MEDTSKSITRVAGYLLGAVALVPLAYYGLRTITETHCPECDARLDIVKRPGRWEPDLLPADED